MRGRVAGLVVALALGAGLVACSGDPGDPGDLEHLGALGDPGNPGEPAAPADRTHTPVTIAFAGDTHFAGGLVTRLDSPATAMGPLASLLASADLGVLNLETAVTTRGAPQAKEFTFRAPATVFTALKGAGVDVVTMANNHALDYGPTSVPDALAAAQAAGMPVVGLGADDQQAFAAWTTTVKGERIAFLGATAVVDDSLVRTWSAGPGQAGVATALDGRNERLVAAVRAARAQADTVVVELHYGKDLTTCPTPVQRRLATDLVAAGADIVVGQHAHVLLGGGYLGSAYVHYGMGNFQFYASNGGTKSETGVLVLTAAGRIVSNATWHPGRIVDGLPTPLTGAAEKTAATRWEGLRGCAGLTAGPTPRAG
jgi:poly-gamma-glutamate synthesis protein (capsule biosynthesis protein)